MKDLKKTSLNRHQIEAMNELKEILLRRYNGRLMLITLFGSRARGERHWQSDVDILVVTRKRTRRFDSEIIDIETELDDRYDYKIHFSITAMSFSKYRWMVKRQWPFILTVKEDGIEIWRNPELKI